MAEAVRQRYKIATGGDAGLPAPSKKPRFKHGGDTGFQKYGNGYRKAPKKK